jgi:hypothetical protein
MSRINRPNWYDFARASKEKLQQEQSSYLEGISATNKMVLGSGVSLEAPVEVVVFDSSDLTSTQQGYVAVNTFDGRGVLAAPVLMSDQSEGNQLVVELADSRLAGSLSTIVTILGKTFDDTLIYEHVELVDNGFEVTRNHFKEVTNILFQNLKGNNNTTVDGYGSRDVGGTLTIKEVSAFRISRDTIVDQQVLEPDMTFRGYKVYDSGKTLSTVLQEALGASNNLDDLNINTTAAQQRTFSASGTTDIIYAQKFKMQGTNIQKVSMLMSVASAGTWSGSLVVGIRPLQTTQSNSMAFLPDNEIDFDPDTTSVEEISVTYSELEDRGFAIGTTPTIVDFVFTGTNISNPNLSTLLDNTYYVLTVRRTGSTAVNSISLEEARNSDATKRLSVYQSGVWTDVSSSSMWYRIFNDSLKVASGVAYETGTRITVEKTQHNADLIEQHLESGLTLTTTSEGISNYVVVQKATDFLVPERHPRTGDTVMSVVNDVPEFSVLTQAETDNLLDIYPELLVLAKVEDSNARNNPVITGTLTHPGLAMGNVVHVINPSSSLLNHNVVGSILTPNTSKPTLRYRITKQTTYSDLYGDVNGDSVIDLLDANRVSELDGYATDLESGTVLAATQLAAIQNGSVSILEILRGDVDNNGEINLASDLNQINNYINSGTAFTGGTGFTRVTLELEPLTNAYLYLDSDARSTLQIEDLDPDLIDNSSFATVSFEITPVAVWSPHKLSIIDIRRFSCNTFLDFSPSDLTSTPPTGGKNNLLLPGDVYLSGSVKNLDGTPHSLDYERTIVELELPAGDTEGEINIFESFVVGRMRFSDGTLVSRSALNNSQVLFEVSIASHAKNVNDGYDYDGYVDFTGLGEDADEVIGTYLSQTTGILRINAYGIVHNSIYPQVRTRLQVTISLKKAGFANAPVYISADDFDSLLI